MPATDSDRRDAWRPGASLETLKVRATLMRRVREHFFAQGILEVDTPVLSRAAATDPAIASLRCQYQGPGAAHGLPLYLHSSPEHCMKRLLASGSGSIYQLSHVFRDGERGSQHNPEFMLLEWYRPGIDYHQLMDEIDALLACLLEGFCDYRPAHRVSYRQWFLDATGLDPWQDDAVHFQRFAAEHFEQPPAAPAVEPLEFWLNFLVSHWLQPRSEWPAWFVYDYPASQAAMARVSGGPLPVAQRFELYLQGTELANGYQELDDGAEQLRRFQHDNQLREAHGAATVPVDRRLISALDSGLPRSAGVALGFDRLVMVAAGLDDIDAAVPFSLSRV